METSNLNITSLQDLEKYSHGQIVELPPFAEGQPFIARIKRPSMLALIKSGRIPNSLLTVANGLFTAEQEDILNEEDSMAKLFDLLDIIAEACLLEPSYSQIREAGLELSDDQYMFIFNYTQRGVKALESFR